MALPEGLAYLKLGWWLIHILSTLLIWSYAYRKGRQDERRQRREKDEAERAARTGAEPR